VVNKHNYKNKKEKRGVWLFTEDFFYFKKYVEEQWEKER